MNNFIVLAYFLPVLQAEDLTEPPRTWVFIGGSSGQIIFWI